MSIMSDKWIRTQSLYNQLITPFVGESKSTLPNGTRVTSYGLSSYGYDLSLGDSFRLFNIYDESNTPASTVENRFFVVEEKSNAMGEPLVLRIPYKGLAQKEDGSFSTSVIDPSNFDEHLTTLVTDVKTITIPPHGFMLAVSNEYIKLARGYAGICMEKSTLARCGLCVTVTPLEPEWEGYLTLEISNKTDLPIKLTTGMGICQLIFNMGNEDCEVSYKDRKGKYFAQPSRPVLAK